MLKKIYANFLFFAIYLPISPVIPLYPILLAMLYSQYGTIAISITFIISWTFCTIIFFYIRDYILKINGFLK